MKNQKNTTDVNVEVSIEMSNIYTLVDVRDIKTCETRTDGRYPNRIGSQFKFAFFAIGHSAILEYIKDNTGADKIGTLITSIVQDVNIATTPDKANHFTVAVETLNSLYIFETGYTVMIDGKKIGSAVIAPDECGSIDMDIIDRRAEKVKERILSNDLPHHSK